MPKYRFAVRSKEGKLRTGTVTEASLDAAKARLTGAGFLIVSLQEEAEMVIHEAKAPSGVTRPRTERAAIIEFELSTSERIGAFLGRFVLRKEIAAALFLAGAGWAGYQFVTAPKPAAPVEVKFLPMSVEVTVDPGSLAGKGEKYQVMLPDVPLQFSQPVRDGSVLKYSFEFPNQPGRVRVRLLEGESVLGEGDGLLSTRQEGLLVGLVALSPVKAKSASR